MKLIKQKASVSIKTGDLVKRKQGHRRYLVEKVLPSGLVRCFYALVKDNVLESRSTYIEKRNLKKLKTKIHAVFTMEAQ